MATLGAAASPAERDMTFQPADERLEVIFVRYLARRTLYQRVVQRSLLLVVWAFSWQEGV